MKKLVNFRLDEELIEQMNKVAELENRSLTNMVETVMKNYCQTQLPPQAVKVRGAVFNNFQTEMSNEAGM